MIKAIVNEFFDALSKLDIVKLKALIHEHCLLMNYDNKSTMNRDKIIKIIKDLHQKHKIDKFNILNSVSDSDDTLLVSYVVFTKTNTTPIYGSMIIRIHEQKINHIKNFLVS